MSRPAFYKLMFAAFGIGFWLTIIAQVLALISTAGLFPDFIQGGSVDLYLSKPISRARLFLTKYATGLLFAGLQVFVFTAASFLVLGIRGGSWEPRLFLAVPLVVLVFSFLYCVCVLLGLLTRSTVAALMLTILFWLIVFGLRTTDEFLLKARIAKEMETEAYERLFHSSDEQAKQLQAEIKSGDASASQRLEDNRKRRRELVEKKEKSDPSRRNLITAHRIFFTIRSVFPKTDAAENMLVRTLRLTPEETSDERTGTGRGSHFGFDFGDRTEIDWMTDQRVNEVAAKQLFSRSIGWVVWTSVAFEVVVLGMGCWVFCRRDF
jgi:hypothetical protein